MTSTLKNKGSIKPVFKYGLMFAIVAAGLTFGAMTAGASDNISCYDVVRQGMDVDYNGTGVFNSGKPIFDEIVAGAPAYAYQGCLEDVEAAGWPDAASAAFGAPGSPYYQVKGWAWNDNLGWISMYCKGGSNLGVACGPINYGVTIDPSGNLQGYAWGDNTGWIRFNNGAFSRVKINVDLPECQGYVYSNISNPAPGICPAHTKSDTMAWSDNVGWMDFDGVIFPWYQVVEMLTDAEVVVELTPDPNTKFKTAALLTDRPPVANGNVSGTDNYLVRVTIKDKAGLLIEEPRYITTITLNWLKDTVKKNQIKGGTALAALPACEAVPNANRAVTKPCGLTWAANYLGGGIWEGIISSLAPTSNMNRRLSAGDVEVFNYEKFKSPSNFLPTPLETNDLTLGSADISVFDTANGLCAYGDVVTCAPRNRGFNLPPITNVVMKFVPQTEIFTLNEDDHADYIDVGVNDPQGFTIQGQVKPGATVTLTGGMDAVAALAFAFDTNLDDLLEWAVDPTTYNVEGLLDGGLYSFVAGVAQQPETQVSQILKGLHIYSTVNEGNGVQYYSNKLPRVIGSTAIQPVAVLRGSVYSTGAVTTTTTVTEPIRSLGDISTNILRDRIYENVMSLVAGAEAPTGYVNLISGYSGKGFAPDSGQVKELLPDGAGVPKVYFIDGSVGLNNGAAGPITWEGERTIIALGGNIYINSDLYNAAATPRPKLGLIALKDYSAPQDVQDKQGHIYIYHTVSNIQANIFADGSVFSYTLPSMMFAYADGRPNFGNLQNYEDATKYHQLFIEGSVASNNTIGGANRAQKIDGLGRVVSSGNAEQDMLTARQYDLNYLRMYTGLINRDASGNALNGSGNPVATEGDLKVITTNPPMPVPGLPWSKYATPTAGDLYPPAELDSTYVPAPGLNANLDLGSTYIYYDPPTQTMPGFQSGSEFEFTLEPG